jgi:hypothetical protein
MDVSEIFAHFMGPGPYLDVVDSGPVLACHLGRPRRRTAGPSSSCRTLPLRQGTGAGFTGRVVGGGDTAQMIGNYLA